MSKPVSDLSCFGAVQDPFASSTSGELFAGRRQLRARLARSMLVPKCLQFDPGVQVMYGVLRCFVHWTWMTATRRLGTRSGASRGRAHLRGKRWHVFEAPNGMLAVRDLVLATFVPRRAAKSTQTTVRGIDEGSRCVTKTSRASFRLPASHPRSRPYFHTLP